MISLLPHLVTDPLALAIAALLVANGVVLGVVYTTWVYSAGGRS